jgi:quinol-cytochrome oxidoreductase complex cytochrome b subunit
VSEVEVRARSPLTRVASGAVVALIVELVVLAITGTALFFIYRPTAAQAWDDIATLKRSARTASAERDVHRVAGRLAIWTALVAAVMIAIEPGNRARWIRSTALGVGLLQVILLASFTGYLFPWDQLALWAVTGGHGHAWVHAHVR